MRRAFLICTLMTAIAGCQPSKQPLAPLPPAASDNAGLASPRTNGAIAADRSSQPGPEVSPGRGVTIISNPTTAAAQPGDVTLNFVDTDIKEVVREILGDVLHVNYTIDPAVKGTATVELREPLPRAELAPVLETLLNQNGATLVRSNGLYRVVPASIAANEPAMAGDVTFGTEVAQLRYASAKELARVLQPFVGNGAKLAADPSQNALLVSGEPGARATLMNLIRSFDVDLLAGQSYGLFPVTSGDPGKVASELQKVFQTEGDGALAGIVRVVPMERVNAVLMVAPQRRYIEDAERLFHLVDRARLVTARSWHVYYVQNGDSGDLANLLQRAFNPKGPIEQPSPSGTGGTAPGQGQSQISGGASAAGGLTSGFNNNSNGLPGSSNGTTSTGASGGLGSGFATMNGANGQPGAASGGTQMSVGGGASPANEPLSASSGESGGKGADDNAVRIIANRKNNALLIYATAEEESTIESMLRKIDIVPLQVRIDCTIAEVDLNDTLQYGTQFYFQSGGLNGLLSTATTAATQPTGTLPGFVLNKTSSAVHVAISALQDVTNVRILSSPQLLVMDNQMARLQVGDDVPYLTQSAQSTLTSTSDVINSVSYRETGVILQVLPKVNSGGLVSLDIAQEVSGVANTTSSSIDSPTFTERMVQSHVVVQDGQTVGIAGLITDNVSRDNGGIPYLKDIPVVGSIFSNQNNSRQRTELLVFLTPHVLQDQRDARALTQDMREKLINAGLVPQEVNSLPASGSANPNGALTR